MISFDSNDLANAPSVASSVGKEDVRFRLGISMGPEGVLSRRFRKSSIFQGESGKKKFKAVNSCVNPIYISAIAQDVANELKASDFPLCRQPSPEKEALLSSVAFSFFLILPPGRKKRGNILYFLVKLCCHNTGIILKLVIKETSFESTEKKLVF